MSKKVHKDRDGDLDIVATESRHACPFCEARVIYLQDDADGGSLRHIRRDADKFREGGCPHVADYGIEEPNEGEYAPQKFVHYVIFTEDGNPPEKENGCGN